MSKQEITSKVEHIKTLQAMIDEMTAEMESVKDEVKAEMTAQGVEDRITCMLCLKIHIIHSLKMCESFYKSS